MKSILTISAVAFTATAIFNINSTLMIDLYPSKPASATAIVSDEITLATLIETNGLLRITLSVVRWAELGLDS
jgi:uncharacterized protein involved in exopolysaccharide biosynthesis